MTKILDRFVNMLFKYRLIFVTTALIGIFIVSCVVFKKSTSTDKLKNVILIWTGGSIVLGIYYSIINYEYNQFKFRHDLQKAKINSAFSICEKMDKNETIEHLKNLKVFYENNKNLFLNKDWVKVDLLIKTDNELRASYINLFNYFERISIGIVRDIIDEETVRNLLKSIFNNHYYYYGGYIEYLRTETGNYTTYLAYTNIIEKWRTE